MLIKINLHGPLARINNTGVMKINTADNKTIPLGSKILNAYPPIVNSKNLNTISDACNIFASLIDYDEGNVWPVMNINELIELIEKSINLRKHSGNLVSNNATLSIANFPRSSELKNLRERIIVDSNFDILIHQLINGLDGEPIEPATICAYALGRLVEDSIVIQRLIELSKMDDLVIKLKKMLLKEGNEKLQQNACFCLGSLASTHLGHDWILRANGFMTDDSNPRNETSVLSSMSSILNSTSEENRFLVLGAIRALISRPKGLVIVRRYQPIIDTLKKFEQSPENAEDIQKEARLILEQLSPLSKAPKPEVVAYGSTSALIRWEDVLSTRIGLPVKYQLYYKSKDSSDPKLAYSGTNSETRITNLKPYTRYWLTLSLVSEIEHGPCSDPTFLLTQEAKPLCPINLCATHITPSKVRITWSPPKRMNGKLRHYQIRVVCLSTKRIHRSSSLIWKRAGKKYTTQTSDTGMIISGLHPNTPYLFSVAAVNGKGFGHPAMLTLETLDSDPYWPTVPNLLFLGRSEAILSWDPPRLAYGRIMRYDVYQNQLNEPVYSGLMTRCRIDSLSADTEYTFAVVAVTNSGKVRSQPVSKRTPKIPSELFPSTTGQNLPTTLSGHRDIERISSSEHSTLTSKCDTSEETQDEVASNHKLASCLASLSVPCFTIAAKCTRPESGESSFSRTSSFTGYGASKSLWNRHKLNRIKHGQETNVPPVVDSAKNDCCESSNDITSKPNGTGPSNTEKLESFIHREPPISIRKLDRRPKWATSKQGDLEPNDIQMSIMNIGASGEIDTSDWGTNETSMGSPPRTSRSLSSHSYYESTCGTGPLNSYGSDTTLRPSSAKHFRSFHRSTNHSMLSPFSALKFQEKLPSRKSNFPMPSKSTTNSLTTVSMINTPCYMNSLKKKN